MGEDEPNNSLRVRRLMPVPIFNDYHPDPAVSWLRQGRAAPRLRYAG